MRTVPATALASLSPSFFKRSAIACSSIGRLMTTPKAPLRSCAIIKITVRSKRGSPIEGAAIRNWPASETCAGAWAVVGRAVASDNVEARIAAQGAMRAHTGRFCQAEDTGHLLYGFFHPRHH